VEALKKFNHRVGNLCNLSNITIIIMPDVCGGKGRKKTATADLHWISMKVSV